MGSGLVWQCESWAFAKAKEPSCEELLKDSTFPKERIRVGGKILYVEVAEPREKRNLGLMCRRSWNSVDGMLFIFELEEPLTFWTKNTFLPLTIGYFDAQKRLVDIQDMIPVKSEMETPTTYASKKPAQFALEVPQGFFKKSGIGIGARIEFLGRTNTRPK